MSIRREDTHDSSNSAVARSALSQGTFAAKLGVSRRWLIDFENDKVPNPGFATILRALHLLGLSLDVRQSVPIDQLADEFAAGKDERP